jgi:hypothetical protein
VRPVVIEMAHVLVQDGIGVSFVVDRNHSGPGSVILRCVGA